MGSFNLNRVFISIFIFLGTFSILLIYFPSGFLINQTGYSGASAQNKEAIDFYDANGMLVYNYTIAMDNVSNSFLEYGVSQSFDYGLPSGQKIEFWWGLDVGRSMFEIRHTNPGPFGWWTEYHFLTIQEPYRTLAGLGDTPSPIGLEKEHLLNLFNEEYNASFAIWKCDHVTVSAFIWSYNSTKTLSESWDDGYLGVFTSYGVDWEAMKPSAFSLLTGLLLFQAPTLGIKGIGGSILTYIIGLLLWSSIAILTFAIVTSLIPFIRGWIGG